MIKAMATALGVVMMGVGALGAGVAFVLMFAEPVPSAPGTAIGEGAAAGAAGVTRAVEQGGGGGWLPEPVPAADRVIEVVDRISPAAWKVAAASRWLDGRTTSRMVMVKRCSGKAYRCITVKSGRVAGKPIGYSSGSTITIDTGKAQRHRYTAKLRHWLLVHELGHQFGLTHSSGRNIMNPAESRQKMILTSAQRAHLKKR